MEEIIKGAVTLYQLISDSAVSTLLAVTGFLVFLVAFILLHHHLKHGEPEPQMPEKWHRPVLFFSLGTALVLMISAPSLRMLELSRRYGTTGEHNVASQEAVLDNLYRNDKVLWLVRLIPYTQASHDFLNIGKLRNLGRCEPDPCGGQCRQQFVFVADYKELRGMTAEHAVLRVGGSMDEVTGVSAIIFPLYRNHDLFPANARGLLQVAQQVDDACKGKPNYQPFPMELTPPEALDLRSKKVISYSWGAYEPHYQKYCKLAQAFRCAPEDGKTYSALDRIGNLSSDWHPLGMSRTQPEPDPCNLRDTPCAITGWGKHNPPVPDVGARVFLIQNLSLDDLVGRILIDFNKPSQQLIPDIDERPTSL